MTFKEYVFFKNPVGSNVRVRTLINRFNLDENSNLDHIQGKKSRANIAKLQIKYKRKYKK